MGASTTCIWRRSSFQNRLCLNPICIAECCSFSAWALFPLLWEGHHAQRSHRWPSFISLAQDVGSTALGDSVGTQFTLPTLDVCSCYYPQAICPSVRISSNQQESRVQPGLGLFCSKMPGGTGFPPPHRFPSLPCSLETHRPALLQPPGSWAMRLFKLLPKLLPDILGSGSWNERHKTKSFG